MLISDWISPNRQHQQRGQCFMRTSIARHLSGENWLTDFRNNIIHSNADIRRPSRDNQGRFAPNNPIGKGRQQGFTEEPTPDGYVFYDGDDDPEPYVNF